MREWTKATSSGLANGNNRPRGFESSPTNSHKLVSSMREGARQTERKRVGVNAQERGTVRETESGTVVRVASRG